MLNKLYVFVSFFYFASGICMEKEYIPTNQDSYFNSPNFFQELAFAVVKIYNIGSLGENIKKLKNDLQSLILTCKLAQKTINNLIYNYETDENAKVFNELVIQKKPRWLYPNNEKRILVNFTGDIHSYLYFARLGFPYALAQIDLKPYPTCIIKLALYAAPEYSHGPTYLTIKNYKSEYENIIKDLKYQSFASLLKKFCPLSRNVLNKSIQEWLTEKIEKDDKDEQERARHKVDLDALKTVA